VRTGAKPVSGFLSLLVAPARRALGNNGIKNVQQLAKFSEAEILQFHGVGKTSIPILEKALAEGDSLLKRNNHLSFIAGESLPCGHSWCRVILSSIAIIQCSIWLHDIYTVLVIAEQQPL
jgi:hypothetical protein